MLHGASSCSILQGLARMDLRQAEPPRCPAQTKETLTLRASSFGSNCDLGDPKFLKRLDACGIVDLVSAFASFKNEKELKKTDGAKRQRITGGALPLMHACCSPRLKHAADVGS